MARWRVKGQRKRRRKRTNLAAEPLHFRTQLGFLSELPLNLQHKCSAVQVKTEVDSVGWIQRTTGVVLSKIRENDVQQPQGGLKKSFIATFRSRN